MQELYDKIITWFHNSCPFEEGVALYKQHGSNVNLKRIFARGYTEFGLGLLQNELTVMAANIENALPQKTIEIIIDNQKVQLVDDKEENLISVDTTTDNTTQINVESLNLSKIDFAKLPEKLKVLVVKKNQLYKEASALHKKLGLCYTDEARGQLAETIMENMRENAQIWKELDYYKQTNSLLGKHDLFVEKVIPAELRDLPLHELQKRLINRRTNISTYKRWIKENSDKEDICQKKAAKIGEWEIEVLNLEKLLKDGKTL